jgi:general secretion pathway protein N
MKTARYIVFGFFTYLLFVTVTLPANVVYSYWKDQFGANVPLYLQNVEGSVWSGTARQATIDRVQLKKLRWQLRPSRLLLGKAEAALEFSMQDGYGKGVVGHSVLGSSYLQDIEAWIPMVEFMPLVNLQSLNAGGALAVNLGELHVKDRMIASALGTITWQDAEINILKPLPLGSLNVELQPTDEGVKGVLSDQGGPLQAEGLITLTNDGKYDLNATVAVRDPLQTDLKNALRTIGPTDRSGKTQLKASGDLANLGLI